MYIPNNGTSQSVCRLLIKYWSGCHLHREGRIGGVTERTRFDPTLTTALSLSLSFPLCVHLQAHPVRITLTSVSISACESKKIRRLSRSFIEQTISLLLSVCRLFICHCWSGRIFDGRHLIMLVVNCKSFVLAHWLGLDHV